MKKLLSIIISSFIFLPTLADNPPQVVIKLPPYPNPGVVEVKAESFDRVFAISDVHGMYLNLRQLLIAQHIVGFEPSGEVHWLAGNSLLVVVGDSIDKGPDSLEVLALWIALREKAHREGGGEVLHLLGNHEAEFLADPLNKKAVVFLDEIRRKLGMDVDQIPRFLNTPVAQYMRQMPIAARVGNWLFCHSGLYPQIPWPVFQQQLSVLLTNGLYKNDLVTGVNSILEAKDWWEDPQQRLALEANLFANHFYGVVFGHQPSAFGVRDDIVGVDQLRLIKIDTGMAPRTELSPGGFPGHLLYFSQAKQLNMMAPPEAYSLSVGSVRRLPTQ